MISLLYKRYALVFFLLWILAALSLAVAVLLSECAGHGTNSVGDRPITGSYRQV